MKLKFFVLVSLGSRAVRSAIALDGSWQTDPLASTDPAPISDPSTYIPDQHDCPLPCADYGNPNSWILYLSASRLERCNEPMLFDFSVQRRPDDRGASGSLRACTIGGTNSLINVPAVETPKKSRQLYRCSIETAPACKSSGSKKEAQLDLLTSTNGMKGDLAHIGPLLRGFRDFFAIKDNCDERLAFGYHQNTVVVVYNGARLGNATIPSVLDTFEKLDWAPGHIPSRIVGQVCGENRVPSQVFGLMIDSSGDLAMAQTL